MFISAVNYKKTWAPGGQEDSGTEDLKAAIWSGGAIVL